jgi:LacI family transcriptional regulator
MLRFPLLPTVNSDDLAVGHLAAQHFHGRRHRHFAYVGDRYHAAARLRWTGFQQAAKAWGATASHHYLPHDESDAPYPARQRRDLLRWLRQLPRPVGVFCFTDRVAVEVADACERDRLRVPEDVAILGTGNDATRLDFAHVEVSSIQLDTARIGELAAETLHNLLRKPRRQPAEILVPPQRISIRRSTDKLAVEDEVVTHALEHIGTHAGNTIYVDDIARTAGVSRRSLELRFRRALGTSVYDQVQRVRFERVVELLTNPGLSLDEIAFSTGFGSLAAFSRMFRRHFDASPSAYRQSLLGAGKLSARQRG